MAHPVGSPPPNSTVIDPIDRAAGGWSSRDAALAFLDIMEQWQVCDDEAGRLLGISTATLGVLQKGEVDELDEAGFSGSRTSSASAGP